MNKDSGIISPEKLVDHLFRHEYGKMVSVLVRVFGPSNISLVEDVVQDAFIKAIGTWRYGNIPDNPAGWLHRVAKNKAIDILRSEKSRNERNLNYHQSHDTYDKISDLFLDKEIADSQLRLIFTCCNLELSEGDRIAVTLKFISGFGVKEIAKALMLKEETAKKRIHRAKQKLKSVYKGISIPSGIKLKGSLETVHTIIYLLFNEGYNSIKQDQLIRKDLCAEAMRLCKLITDHPKCRSSESYALMALMCYHAARLDSRMTPNQEIILLHDQDRSKWHRPLIQIGHHYFGESTREKIYSIYHLEAAIAAQHCESKDIITTNWKVLIKLYQLLYEVKPSPAVRLNLAVALKQHNDHEEAIEIIESLSPDDFIPNPYLFYAVAASLFLDTKKSHLARIYLEKSLETVTNDAERKLLEARLSKLLNMNNE